MSVARGSATGTRVRLVIAVEAVARLAPDVVILDVRMPRLDGIATTAQIKQRWQLLEALQL